jgi:hypothetical protein
MAADDIVCPVCGAKNPGNIERCRSCGARIEAGTQGVSDEELEGPRHQQDTFEWKWVGVAFGIYFVLQAIVLAVLPAVIYAYDPQGLPGMLISMAIWFVGGAVVGVISPGRTFIEPAIGAMFAAVPTMLWLRHIADVHQQPLYAYVFAGVMGVMVTLFGAFLGELVQGQRGRAKA